ncbi:hypothetical protein ABE26_02165 [Cytobacillus firmus]|nr:hypothetical protein [Cytobacillus firmus]
MIGGEPETWNIVEPIFSDTAVENGNVLLILKPPLADDPQLNYLLHEGTLINYLNHQNCV